MRSVRQTLTLTVAVVVTASAWADVPRLISYQGRLASGVTGTVDLEIDVHKDPVLDVSQFNELHVGVPVSDGVFSILIGSETVGGVPEAVYNSTARWIGVSVDGAPELLPRARFTLVPFAARSLHADGLVIPGDSLQVAVVVGADGDVTMRDDDGNPQVRFDLNGQGSAPRLEMLAADHSTATFVAEASGGANGGGYLSLNDDLGAPVFQFDAGIGEVELRESGNTAFQVEADASGSPVARLSLFDPAGATRLVEIQAAETTSTGPQLFLRDSDGTTTFDLDAEFNADGGAQMALKTGLGVQTLLLDAQSSEGGGEIQVEDAAGQLRVQINAEDPASEGVLTAFADGGNQVFRLRTGQSGDNGQIDLLNQNGVTAVEAVAFSSTTGGRLVLREGTVGEDRIRMYADNGGNNAELALREGTTTRVRLNSAFDGRVQILDGGLPVVEMTGANGGEVNLSQGGVDVLQLIASDVNGDSRVVTDVLQINAGSDLSERFDIRGEVVPGYVVAIDPTTPGGLTVADRAYDTRVAGIVSGAGGVKPGMLMGQVGSIADGAHAVALTGRVWTWCDAGQHPIEAGDLLTTSATVGHAMKVTDPARAGGAMIGKAMTSLESGRGLVLVLVNLQ